MSAAHLLAVLALGAGCLAPAAPDVQTSEITHAVIGGEDEWGCPSWGCGSNSPVIDGTVIDGIAFHELHELGLPNSEGYYIAWFRQTPDGPNYQLDVEGGQIIARAADLSTVSGKGVVGWRMRIQNQRNSEAYEIRIAAADNSQATPFWANPNHLTIFPWTYNLSWQRLGPNTTRPMPLCGNVNGFDADGLVDFYSVVFEGDRIDAGTKVVYGEDPSWFNIGCKGHALAKQHLTAHTRVASQLMQVPTTLDERTANLKMLVADYCGDGQAFTVAGEPLAWKDDNGYTSVPAINAGTEAVWTASGAVCLTEPRIDHNQTTLGMQTFPDGVANSVAKRCPLPTCSGREIGHVVSVLK